MTRQELIDAFTLEGVNRSNAVVNFTEDDPFDPKAVWLNAEHIRAHAGGGAGRARCCRSSQPPASPSSPTKMAQITPLIRERIKLLRDVLTVADFFFVDELPPYDTAELIPKKGDAAMALRVLEARREVLAARRVHPRRAWKPRCAPRPRRWASRPARCSSPSAWRCAAARPRRRCLARWKCWAARPASSASTRPLRS